MRKLTVLCLALVLALGTLSFGGTMATEEILDKDCVINEAVFERDWKKYSDFDVFEQDLKDDEFKKELESRSLEVQKYALAARKVIELEKESLRLQAEIILNGQARREVREIKESLVTMLRANLIKSLFRLSFLTADAIKTGFDAGSTFAELFTFKAVKNLPDALEEIGKIAGVVSGLSPEGAEVAEALGKNAEDMKMVLDTFTSSSDEIAVNVLGKSLSLAEDKAKILFPSWDTVQLSPEDISILESQFMNNKALDDFLEESYAEDRMRSARIRMEIPAETERLREEMNVWEGKEKERVRDMLVAGCLESKKKAATQGHWEQMSVEVHCITNSPNSEYTLSSGGGTLVKIGALFIPEKDREFFKMSFSWNEPEARYEADKKITLKISAKIDEWKNPSQGLGGWIRASIDDALRDEDGHSDVEVGGTGGKIVVGSDTKTVWRKLSGGREGDYFVLDISTPSGHVYYRYEWQD